ncbi:hypothetical protein REC12_24975 [Desulfosporosinus sp. PR]|uniref:hypothetical protein n=1 Tax=Candidatus Desulfosporosinus nitrosoreducens TaxID=3401928 RepID=UPI0027EC18DE|nr:hypothetical protein [Desulfosporosinus sp. PR]MDQ7096851.1 hypothetical protein [Desulfosporosinus sp. PR]
MEKKEIVELSCKVLAIYTIFNGFSKEVVYLFNSIILPFFIPTHIFPGYQYQPKILVEFASSCQYLILLLLGVVLWLLSKKIANRIGIEKYSEDMKISVGDIRNVAFSILGLFFIGSSLPQIVNPIVQFFSEKTLLGGPNWASIEQLLQIVTQLAFGLFLLFYAQGLVRFLRNPEDPEVNHEKDS